MAFKDVLLGILTGGAEQVEEISIETGLQSLHDSDPAIWAEACTAGQLFAQKVGPHVKGKFPAAMIDGLTKAIKQSQDANPGPAQTGDTAPNENNG